jgi:hypothetical protein
MIFAALVQWKGTCRGATALTAHGACRGTQLPDQPPAAHQACSYNKIARRSWRLLSPHMSGWTATEVQFWIWDLSAVNASELAASQQAAARPWSAPATRQRFDPTKYVREQQQRERLLAARFGRRPVTPGASSRGTPTRSAGRPESAAPGAASRLCASKLQCALLSDVIMPGRHKAAAPTVSCTLAVVLLRCRRTTTLYKTFISQPGAGALEGSTAGNDAPDAHILRQQSQASRGAFSLSAAAAATGKGEAGDAQTGAAATV